MNKKNCRGLAVLIVRCLTIGLIAILFCTIIATDTVSARPDRAEEPIGKIVAKSRDAYVSYDEKTNTWEIGTDQIRRRMKYDSARGFRLTSLMNKLTAREWLAEGERTSDELTIELRGQIITAADRDLSYRGYATNIEKNGSVELVVSLSYASLLAHMHYATFPGTGVIESWTTIESAETQVIDDLIFVDSTALTLRHASDDLTLTWINGPTSSFTNRSDPQPLPTLRLRHEHLIEGMIQNLGSTGRSTQESMGWFVLGSNELGEGLFGGLEWSGAWSMSIELETKDIELSIGIGDIRHDLTPRETLQSPRRFLGFFKGDLDDAANASHLFARNYLLRPKPTNFPWTQYNTWYAYGTDFDEEVLRREADAAAQLGLEVFYVDAGWYEGSPRQGDFSVGLGTWRENREKFPSGIAAFADYVHSKGMKFGLWVEPERMDLNYAGREIPREWLAGANNLPNWAQVCLGNREAREWTKEWLTRVVRDYKVDWLKWDYNVWISCDKADKPGEGNYAHIMGLYEVLDYLRQKFPNLIIENCASGGNRMDFGLMRRTDVAWLSDDTEPSHRVRYQIAGASYAFPPEYLNTWLIDSSTEELANVKDPRTLKAWLRSRMMGAFGISINTEYLTPDQLTAIADEIKVYKGARDTLVNGRVYRLLPQTELSSTLEPPDEPEAAEFYNETTKSGWAFLFQGAVPWDRRRVILKGLNPTTNYRVVTMDRSLSLTRTGQQLMTQGIRFTYDASRPSVLLSITPVR